jgi:small nuclear ribonucleoprotein (snRNP)-like protein
MLFYSFFKTLVGKEIAVELKNDVALTGTLHSVDQYLNIKLNDVNVVDAEKYPQLVRPPVRMPPAPPATRSLAPCPPDHPVRSRSCPSRTVSSGARWSDTSKSLRLRSTQTCCKMPLGASLRTKTRVTWRPVVGGRTTPPQAAVCKHERPYRLRVCSARV